MTTILVHTEYRHAEIVSKAKGKSSRSTIEFRAVLEDPKGKRLVTTEWHRPTSTGQKAQQAARLKALDAGSQLAVSKVRATKKWTGWRPGAYRQETEA